MEVGTNHILLAVRALVIEDQKVLLVGHRHPQTDQVWWMAPGGLVGPGEPAMEAARREALEETGLEVEINRLVYWAEWIWEQSHCVELFFLGRAKGGILRAGSDPELTDARQVIFAARFFAFDELEDQPVYPKIFRTLLREHWRRGFAGGPTYLGISQPDLPR